MITPSSNTCLEPMSYRLLGGRNDVTLHFARIPVTKIELDESSDQQFSVVGMQAAAKLLATADVDVITWNGTAGSWRGIDADRKLAGLITDVTGTPAATSTLAYLEAFQQFSIERIGLVTPYVEEVNEQIISTYAMAGIDVISHRHLDLIDNESFARVPLDDIRTAAREVAAARPEAVIFLCTNLPGAPAVQELEQETGVPMLDSVAVTLWDCVRRVPGLPLLDTRWGQLLGP